VKNLITFLASVGLLFMVSAVSFAGNVDLEKDLAKTLLQSQKLTEQALGKIQKGEKATAELNGLAREAEEIKASHMLLQERHNEQAEKARALGGKALQRQTEVTDRFDHVLNELLSLFDSLSAAKEKSPVEILNELKKNLKLLVPAKSRPLLGSLPYRHLNYQVKEPNLTPAIVPAYRADTPVDSAADLQSAPEGQNSHEIANLAQSLGWSPARIYDWVKNNIETEWYWGSMKGAEETLRQKSGNDADQAALLVTLLRSSGFPARYVRGTIEFYPADLAKIQNLTGIDDPEKIADFFRKAGIPVQKVMTGSTVTNYRIEHVWVEAEIPYSNYRGIVTDSQGKKWLGLDTSIKVAGYQNTDAVVDLFSEPANPLSSLRSDYLEDPQTQTPLEYTQVKTQAYLDQNNAGVLYSNILSTRTQRPESLAIVPGSLQFSEIATTGEYTNLPDELLHKVRFTIPGSGDPALDITLNTFELSNQKVVLSFEPETVEDQEIISSWGGLDNTPSYLVQLRPVILVNGERKIVGSEGYPMGGDFTFTTTLISPNGSESETNHPLAGYPEVMGIVAQKVVVPDPATLKNEAVDKLYHGALDYISSWNRGEDELASLLKVSVVRPIPTVVTVGGVLDVTYLLGDPYGAEWKGLFIDAALRAAETVSRATVTDDREKSFMELAALQGSFLENKVFEDAFAIESISTAKLFGIAGGGSVPVITIDSTNSDAVVPTLPFDDNVKADITEAAADGYNVEIPQAEITYHNWTGIGYIKENPVTAEAGYMLSGMIAGGSTVLGVDMWPEDLLSVMISPYSGEPNKNPAEAYSITPVVPAAVKLATAGVEMKTPVMVLVRDVNNIPVQGASVRVTVRAGGGNFVDGSVTPEVQVQTITVKTGSDGIARARFVPGTSTSVNPINYLRDGDTYANIVGENLVDAALQDGSMAALATPMTVLGFAGEPDQAQTGVYGDNSSADILTFSGTAMLALKDKYGNPVANYPVTFASLPASPETGSTCTNWSGLDPARLKAQLVPQRDPCLANIPVWGECSAAKSQISVVSLSDGSASAGVVLGAARSAVYPVSAGYSTTHDGSVTKTISHHSWLIGSCQSGAPANELNVRYFGHVDEFNNNVDARPAGSASALTVKAFLLGEGEKVSINGASLSCDQSTKICDSLIGDGNFSITNPSSLRVSMNGVAAVNGDSSSSSAGLYSGYVTLPVGLNHMDVLATATKDILTISNSCSACGIPSLVTTAISPAQRTIDIWGVEIQAPEMFVVSLDENGYVTDDKTFTYTINPAGYQAGIAQVLMYKNDSLALVVPTGKTGSPSMVIPAGYWFDRNSKNMIEVLLNNEGDPDEIRSVSIPVVFADSAYNGGSFMVDRRYITSVFDSNVPSTIGSPYVDSYQTFPFTITETTFVKATILDENMTEKAVIVPETSLGAGDYNFLVDYQTVKDAGFSITDNPTFYIRLDRYASAGSALHSTIYHGRMGERTTSAKMLGQTIVHDVMIQDGSLNLSREDLSLHGRGPQIEFSRTYNNQDSSRGFKPLGRGWSHSLDLRLQVLSTESSGSNPVPAWVDSLKERFYTAVDVPNDPKISTVVQVNGSTFKKYNGVWYAERSKHGKLTEISGGYLFTSKDGTTYRYDRSFGGDIFVSAVTDRNGNTLSFTYNSSGQLENVTDATGRQLVFTYQTVPGWSDDDMNRLVSLTGPDGISINFTYNPAGYLKTVQRSKRIETYDYARETGIANAEYNLVKATDSNGNSFQYEYYGPGQLPANLVNFVKVLKPQDVVKNVTYPDLKHAHFTYDVSTANKRVVTDLRGHDTTYTLNYYGNPTSIEEPLGKTTHMTWSIDENKPDNVMTSNTDPRTFTTYYEYDAQGNITRETDPYGKSIVTEWNQKYSLPEKRTDRNNVIQNWEYDPNNGNLLTFTDGDTKIHRYTYYPTGELKTATSPRGYATDYTWDQWGNPASETGAEGSQTKFKYDIRGRRTEVTDPNQKTTTYAYDDLDYPTTVTYPAHSSYTLADGSSNVKTTIYDPEGNLVSETDRVGLTLTYTYTNRDQVETITRNIGGKKTFGYDENGNLTSETDWRNDPAIATTHHYDELNRRDYTIDRLNHQRFMGYDLSGNLTFEKDAEGRETTQEYDKLNRLTDTWQPALEGETRGNLHFTYYDEADPKTNLKTETDQEGHTTTYEYNGRYLRTRRLDARPGELQGVHLWEYDDNGNLWKETDEETRLTRFEYDKQDRLTDIYKTLDGVEINTHNEYDPAGNLRYVTDPNTHVTETQYDEWNRPWKVIDPDNYITVSEQDGEGRVVRTVDGNQVERKLLRDKRGLVLTATDGNRKDTVYTYDANGNNETIKDAKQVLTRITYDAEDRKLLTTEAEGLPEERTSGVVLYDKVGNARQVRDWNGNVTVTDYNVLNLPEKVYDPAPFNANYTETKYYKTGKVKTVTDRRQHTTTYEYDELNRLSKVTDPLTRTIVTTYDKVGNVKSVKDKRDILTESDYNELNLLKEKRRAGLRLVTNEYDGAGNLRFVTDARVYRIENRYNKRNLLETTIYPATEDFPETTEHKTYDGARNLKTETDEETKTSTYDYDGENRQTSVEFAGETTLKRYDDVGNLQEIEKPEHNIRTMEYDGLRRLHLVIEGGLTTRYEYDASGNILHQYDARENDVEYAWDELNRKKLQIQHKADGDLVTQFPEYDPEGNLKKLEDPKGQVFTYDYDELNRRTDEYLPETATPYLMLTNVHTDYDGNNNVTTVTETKKDTAGATVTDTTGNTYDNFDRLKTSTTRGITVTYDYDDNGNRTGVSTPSGSTTYTYYPRNWVKTAVAGTATTTFDYYLDGKQKKINYPNGASIAYTYFPTDRVETVTNTGADNAVLSGFTYDYDHNGNRKTQLETRPGFSETTTYDYDDLDRMKDFTVVNGADTTTTDYTFEGYNRKTETVRKNGSTVSARSYDYDETDWLTSVQVSEAGVNKTIRYTYDKNGNTVRKTDSAETDPVVYDYDASDHLVRAMKGTTLLGLYDYNSEGLRIRHRNGDRGDVDTWYDGKAVIEERKGGSLYAHYRYAGRPLSLLTGGELQYYHFDALGSTVNLTNATGSQQAGYFLDPWGHIKSQQGDSVNRQIFTGQEHDENTGLIYFGARYYDPDTARFITEDSYLGEQGTPPSLNRYLYAYSNPTVYVDLEGYAAQAQAQPTVYPETDIFKPSPVRDTGSQFVDDLWAGSDNILNAGKYVVNAGSAIFSAPTIAYAKYKGISVQEANDEIVAGMASTGPLAPYLLTGSLPFRVGPALGYSARVFHAAANVKIQNTVKKTKEVRNGAKEFGQAILQKAKITYETSTLGNEVGAIGGNFNSWNMFLKASKGKFSSSSAASYMYKKILSLKKGSRPDPSTYLSKNFISKHLSGFEDGVTKFYKEIPTGKLGPPSGTFVMPKKIADELIKKAGGDVSKLEKMLGLNPGDLGPKPVRADIINPKGIRMPSGNELGANGNWRPGGFTRGGVPEAIINPVTPGNYSVSPLY
jgi:RHS repeat-associated protein